MNDKDLHIMDFYGRELRPVKANLHTHSTVSDGQFPPEEVIRLYREHGYGALAFTDHRKTNPVGSYDGGGMTLISGIELHPMGPRGIPWHLLALGVPEGFPGEFDSAPAAIAAVNAAGGIVFAAHPYWCGLTSAEVMSLEGVCGTEVYNTSTRYIGKAYNMQLWDEILDAGRRFSALAVDDMHRVPDQFRGWTMICAGENTPAALVAALKAGDFYASQGPEFRRLSYRDGIFEAEFSPCVEAVLMTAQARGYCGLVPETGKDEETCKLRIDLRNQQPARYLRCQIRDRRGNYAWSMPLYLD